MCDPHRNPLPPSVRAYIRARVREGGHSQANRKKILAEVRAKFAGKAKYLSIAEINAECKYDLRVLQSLVRLLFGILYAPVLSTFLGWRMDNPFSSQQSLNIALRQRKDSMVALYVGSRWNVVPNDLGYEMGNGVFCTRNGEPPSDFDVEKQKLGCGYFRHTFTGTSVHMPDLLAVTDNAPTSTKTRSEKIKASVPPFCLILQHKEQAELYVKYHRNGVFLDATHGTNK